MDWLTIFGTVVTLIGTGVTIQQARAAAKSKKDAEAYFNAISSVRKAVALSRICDVAEQARTPARQMRQVASGGRGLNAQKAMEILEELIHELGLNSVLLAELDCKSHFDQLKADLVSLRAETDPRRKAEFADSLLTGFSHIHIASNSLKQRLELPEPSATSSPKH